MSKQADNDLQFHDMGLDDRILKAIAALGWRYPTAIQEKMIPLALEGKDVLARARTGSGKTAAYCIPLIQKILHSKQTATEQVISAVILTPTKELCSQACRNMTEVSSCCSREIRCIDISPHVSLFQQRPQLMECPDVVIGTPTRILAHIKAGNLSIKESLTTLVIDEADLVFSFGYEDDIKNLLSELPKIYQALMMSATMSEELQALKKMVLHNPVILKLRESQLPEASQLAQYHIKCEEEDKFTLIYAFLKLRLIRGKSIIFVNSVDRCYRLKLFLQQFVIRSCVLNSEMPVNSRCHIVNQFNDGLYDTIIASDERMLFDPEDKPQKQIRGKKMTRKKDKEYGVSRGIDFQNVSNIINFDFPPTVDAYIHRVGRTARGDSHGTALSFVSRKEQKYLDEVENTLKDTYSEGNSVFKPFEFRMEEIDGFRYRAKDMMRAVTRVAVKETRLKEIKQELLNSKKLQTHFEDNPRDLQVLRHDKVMHIPKSQQHLSNVPDYLVPPMLRSLSSSLKKSKQGKMSKTSTPAVSKGAIKYQKRKADPLKSFEFAGISKKKKKS